ncbi:hypothetical protein DYH09_17265 [bacterium CPR1]|nr:hypothetical protein [bacterium CPR1]
MALITAMFCVLVVYALVTVCVARGLVDLRITRYAAFRLKARYLARSAVHIGLDRLNDSPDWEAAHRVSAAFPSSEIPPHAEQIVLEPSAPVALVWVQETARPGVLRLRGAARVGGQLEQVDLSVLRRSRVAARVVARQSRASGPDSLYELEVQSMTWRLLPPAPLMVWLRAGGGLTPVAVRRGARPLPAGELIAPTVDLQGSIYAISRIQAARLPPALEGREFVYCLDAGAWGLLPALPDLCWQGGPGGPQLTRTPPADPDRHLVDIAVGGGRLYAQITRAGVDTLYCLVDPRSALSRWEPGTNLWRRSEGTWQVLPAVPLALYDANGKLSVDASRTTGNLGRICVDPHGNLFTRLESPGLVDTLYRFDVQTGQWTFLPPPPPFFYDADEQGRWVLRRAPELPDSLSPPAADVAGNVLTLWNRPQAMVHTLFKFEPSGRPADAQGVVAGQWKAQPVAPRSLYDAGGALRVPEPFTAPRFAGMRVDGAGHLYMQFVHSEGASRLSAVYRYDATSGAEKWEQILPPVQERVLVPDESAPSGYREQPTGALVNFWEGGAGGGVEIPGQVEYVPVSSY